MNPEPEPLSHDALPMVYSLSEAQLESKLGRTTLFRLIDEGALRTIKVGRRRLIVGESLRDLLEGGWPR